MSIFRERERERERNPIAQLSWCSLPFPNSARFLSNLAAEIKRLRIEATDQMAESMSFLVEKLINLLSEEAKLLGQEVAHIKDVMDAMRAFLRDADAKVNSSEEVKVWVKQVRELAYDTEDILDDFMVHLGRQNGMGFIGTLSKGNRFIKHVKARHQIATQIKEIRGQIRDLGERRRAFEFIKRSNAASHQKWHDPRVASLFLEEDEVVGIEGPRDELIKRLVEGEPQLTVISVLGMGGLGKTTLVKKLYDKPEVQQFFDARKDPTPEGINSMTYVQLMKIIKDYLQEKRCRTKLGTIQHILGGVRCVTTFWQNPWPT